MGIEGRGGEGRGGGIVLPLQESLVPQMLQVKWLSCQMLKNLGSCTVSGEGGRKGGREGGREGWLIPTLTPHNMCSLVQLWFLSSRLE